MDESARQRLIDIISWGKILVSEKDSTGKPLPLVLYTPDKEIRARSAIVYELERQQAINDGAIPDNELMDHYIDRNIWDPQTDIEIEGIKDDIKKMKKGLLDFLFQTDKLEKIRSTIRSAEEALIERIMKRYDLLKGGVEAMASIAQQKFIISKITHTATGEKYWPTDEDFDNEEDTALIERLALTFFDKTSISTKQLREIARTSPWRAIWSSIEDPGHLFGIPICDWSKSQKDLVYWSHVYDMAYDSMDRPMQMIIEDDDLLDSWFLRQADKVEQRAKDSSIKAPENKYSKKSGRQEQFIVTDQKGAQMVYSMNDPITRQKIKAKQKIIDKRGKVKEQHMPDSQSEMRQLAVEHFRKKVKGK